MNETGWLSELDFQGVGETFNTCSFSGAVESATVLTARGETQNAISKHMWSPI